MCCLPQSRLRGYTYLGCVCFQPPCGHIPKNDYRSLGGNSIATRSSKSSASYRIPVLVLRPAPGV